MKTDERLLVVHQGALGDFVVTFPALLLLRRRFGHVHVLARGSHGVLAMELDLAGARFPADAALFAALFSGLPDEGIRRFFSPYTHVLLLSFSETLADTIRNVCRCSVCRVPPRPVPGHRIHVADHLLEHLVAIGLLTEAGKAMDTVSDMHKATGADAGDSQGCNILIHPGSGSRKKRWPLKRFARVADRLKERGAGIRFLLGPDEPDLAEALAAQPDPGWAVTIPESLTSLLEILRSSSAFIGNDSGVSHLAAYCGLPTVAVFGPSDPVRWKPVGPAVEVVCPDVDAMPCFETDPDGCPAEELLSRVTAGMVLTAFERVVRVHEKIGSQLWASQRRQAGCIGV